MKKRFTVLFILTLVIGFSMQAHAALSNRGTDSQGNRLIYDSDLNITWYDYTKSLANWQNQMNWTSALSVSGGNLVGVYNDWRLPTTVDGPWVWGYDGTTTGGYNITNSEMGHLFYTELGNIGRYDTSGNPQAGWGLTKTGDFQNLQIGSAYWSGTATSQISINYLWDFNFTTGAQGFSDKYNNILYALAVRPGDVVAAPEPISSILFLTGGATLIGRKYIRRKKIVV